MFNLFILNQNTDLFFFVNDFRYYIFCVCCALPFCPIVSPLLSVGSASADTEGRLRDLSVRRYQGMIIYIVSHLYRSNMYISHILSNLGTVITDVVIFLSFSAEFYIE